MFNIRRIRANLAASTDAKFIFSSRKDKPKMVKNNMLSSNSTIEIS